MDSFTFDYTATDSGVTAAPIVENNGSNTFNNDVNISGGEFTIGSGTGAAGGYKFPLFIGPQGYVLASDVATNSLVWVSNASEGDGGTISNIEFNNIQNNMTEINAVIVGLTGGQPPTDIRHEPFIQTRPPTNQDDITENWHVGNIWVYNDTAYVCVDNSELNAKWKVCSVEIKDDVIGADTTYSSHKIVDEFKKQSGSFDYLLTLKANVSDMNIALSGKANKSAMTVVLNGKADKQETYTKAEVDSLIGDRTGEPVNAYSKNETDNLLNLKSDKATTYSKTETDNVVNALASLVSTTKMDVNNAYSKSEMDTKLNLKADTSDMESKLNLKSNVSDTYTKTEVDSKIDAMPSSILSYQEFPSFEIKNTTGASLPLSNSFVGITVSGSSILPSYYVYDIAPYTAFNKKSGDGSFGWTSANVFYGSNFTTIVDGNTLSVKNGTIFNYYTIYRTQLSEIQFIGKQWLQIDCGEIKLFKGFKINQRTITGNNIKNYHICGSNNGNTFVSLFHTTGEQNSLEIVHSLSYSSPFRYYRLVIEDLQDGGNGVNHYCSIQEFSLLETHNNNDLNKTIDLLNSWITTGKLNVSGISYNQDPIRENY